MTLGELLNEPTPLNKEPLGFVDFDAVQFEFWSSGRKNGYVEISNEPRFQILCLNQDKLFITGFKTNIFKKLTFYTVGILLCGIPFLLLFWYPKLIHLKCIRTCLRCADYVLVKDSNNAYSTHQILKLRISLDNMSVSFQKAIVSLLKIKNEIRYFIHKDLKYIWIDEELKFHQLTGWDDGTKSVQGLLEESFGYTAEEQDLLLQIYGKNEISVSIPSSWRIILNEIFRPFYLFQFFSIVLWLLNDYLSYAVCVVILTSVSVFITLFSTKKQRKSIKILAGRTCPGNVHVIRKGGAVEEINPCFLVPGDVIQIPRTGCIMPCDALLLHGNCIVNEYTLTGESYPVTKTPPISSNNLFNSIILKRHVLFYGTEVVQTRYYGEGTVTAITVSTGFSTTKGELIRCLLHPKPLGFKFHEDSVKLLFTLFFVAICGIFYLFHVSFKLCLPVKTLVYDSLDLITIVVPPALPAALSAGIAYSRSRLLSKGIFCSSPPKINIFGKLKLMCFDKTGTLTEEGLDLWGVLPCSRQKFTSLIENPSVLGPKHPLVIVLATCHTLTKIEGKISGNPLDLSMFNCLNWELNEPGNDTCRYDLLCPTIVKPKLYRERGIKERPDEEELPYEIGIVREFPFTSASRCMSVITRELGADHMNLYCKGAPEKIGELCKPDSLPDNFNEELQMYASMGFRILGVGYKKFDQKFTWMKSQRVKREDVENELIFLGLIIMQNKLKSVSKEVVNNLRMANIRCVMITGDNLFTAISVSRECLMVLPGENIIEVKVTPSSTSDGIPSLSFHPVEPINCNTQFGLINSANEILKIQISDSNYAMDGKTWELLKTHYNDLIPKIIVRGTVFARMLPEQKAQLVEAFQDLGYIVGMCGDGANDYGAMRAAHVGVSLSETESTVVAPFTSKVQDVSCIVSLVQEGRCALTSTFVIFKYMTMYSLIQFMSVIIIYENNITFSNTQFLYVDLIVTSLLALVIGRTGPSKVVVKTRPITRLMSFSNLFPLFLQIIILFFTQKFALQFLYQQNWFIPAVSDSEAVIVCWENTVIYCISLFQYLILALVYSKGKPYRQPFYSDRFFVLVFIAMTVFTILLSVYPFWPLDKIFFLVPVEKDTRRQTLFRVELLMFPLLNLLLSLLIEVWTSNQKCLKNVIYFVKRKKESKNKYKRILSDPFYSFV